MHAIPELTKLFNNITIHLAQMWAEFDPVESNYTARESLLDTAFIPKAIKVKRPTLELPDLELNTHQIVELLEGRDFDTLKLIADECLASESKEVTLESDELQYTITLGMLTTYNDRLSEHCNVEGVSQLNLSPEHQLAATFFHHTACMISVNHGTSADENDNAIELLATELEKERVQNPTLDLNEIDIDTRVLWTYGIECPDVSISPWELLDASKGTFSDDLMEQLSLMASLADPDAVLLTSVGKVATVKLTVEVVEALQQRINKDKKEIK